MNYSFEERQEVLDQELLDKDLYIDSEGEWKKWVYPRMPEEERHKIDELRQELAKEGYMVSDNEIMANLGFSK